MISEKDYKSEIDYYKKALTKVYADSDEVKKQLEGAKDDATELIQYISGHYYNMDAEERVSMGQAMDEKDLSICELITRDKLLSKQKLSPYFGKVDFKADDTGDKESYYIGIGNVSRDEVNSVPFVCDWRAPVSSLYYDYEVGRAKYSAPLGEIDGDITNKRQFKIENGEMKFCFDSSLTIDDDILKQALSSNTDAKMKNIVATIQKEQNQIVRAPLYENLVVQGLAGSGKTSIALHRIAFLLYRYKSVLKSKNILILSPNKIFSAYIADVLPELGEQNAFEITFGELAKEELRGYAVCEDRQDMLEDLLAGNKTRNEQVVKKNSKEFMSALEGYLFNEYTAHFVPEDIVVGEVTISKDDISKLFYERYSGKEISKRIDWIADYIYDQLVFEKAPGVALLNRVKKRLYKMLATENILTIYEDFLKTQNMTLNFSAKGGVLFEDIAPLLYIKDYVVGIIKDKSIKYMIIDEMQDYGPLHYKVFNKMFACPKIVLGDIYQTIEKKLTFDYLGEICSELSGDANVVKINKTYRSTAQIARFGQSLVGIDFGDNIDREGEKPSIQKVINDSEQIGEIIECLKQYVLKGYGRVAVVTKTIAEAKKVFASLEKQKVDCMLVDSDSLQITSNVIVTSCGLSKGLEFDAVIVPNASKMNYKTEEEKNVLYISSTRALHALNFFHTGEITPILRNVSDELLTRIGE